MEGFEVENKAMFVAAWISYLSTATGILKSLGVETDLVDVSGYSGYAAFSVGPQRYLAYRKLSGTCCLGGNHRIPLFLQQAFLLGIWHSRVQHALFFQLEWPEVL